MMPVRHRAGRCTWCRRCSTPTTALSAVQSATCWSWRETWPDIVPTRLVTFGARDREERVGSLAIRVIGGAWFVRGQRSNPSPPRLIGEVRRADVVHCHQQHMVMSSLAAADDAVFGGRVFCTDLGGGGWDVSAYMSTDSWYHGHLHISEYSRRIAGHDRLPSGARGFRRGGREQVLARRLARSTAPSCSSAACCRTRASTTDRRDRAGMHAEIIGPGSDARYLEELGRARAARRCLPAGRVTTPR